MYLGGQGVARVYCKNLSLLRQCASDLLRVWLDGTEQNLARAFRQAQHTQSVLLTKVR